jgi:hypothetical protein
MSRKPFQAGLILVLAGLAWASCSNRYAFLDEFPDYPPTEPYLENQELQAKRVEWLRRERARREREQEQRTSEEKSREWAQLQAQQERGLAALEAREARRARSEANPRTKAEDLEQWNRIVGQ